ncbi:LysR family transcriptional regulator [Psychrobacillus psychrodurans]|uniref:LysR family transcriptional regulator n=1 Tax=Psychrobacillus psychrodurans TaxID=126157 RepID=UPI0008E5AAC2|nr:LysR family transcriptional regulator [Psychrobacillus psychrodurans]MCZ8539677.1 LysR family transcriptional regulator [Psychrobacillus psychrodurans]SFM94654.1 LysR family transcriptional regulator, repressor for citA [Psychrobacillus psychrodurans]
MEYQWLKTFCIAAETLNFRKASEKLMMSQPSVTVHIRLLEEHLGSTLFDRQNNRVTLSEAGRYFLLEAQKLLNNTESTIHKMHAFKQGYRRTWTIAISPLMAETILPYFLRSFMKLQPDLEITIRVEESYLIEGLVDSGAVNIGISALDAQTKGVESIIIYKEPILFVMPVDIYDEESGPPIDIKGVLQNNYLFTHHHPVFWDDLLVKLHKNISGIRTMKVTQAHIAKRFVQDDLGVSFLPHSIVRRELLEGKIMQPHFDLFDLPTVSTFIILKKKGDLEKLFIEQISKYYFG